MTDAGILLGLPRDKAHDLIVQSAIGAAVMLRDSGEHPVKLRENVTSPAGTTINAIRELENHGVRAALIAALEAARDRSRELASGNKLTPRPASLPRGAGRAPSPSPRYPQAQPPAAARSPDTPHPPSAAPSPWPSPHRPATPPPRTPGSAHSSLCLSCTGLRSSTTASAVSFFKAPYDSYTPARLLRGPTCTGGEDLQQIRHPRPRLPVVRHLPPAVGHCPHDLLPDHLRLVEQIDDPGPDVVATCPSSTSAPAGSSPAPPPPDAWPAAPRTCARTAG